MLILYVLERGSPASITSTISPSGLLILISFMLAILGPTVTPGYYRRPESDIESDKEKGVAVTPAAADSSVVGVTSEPIYRNRELVIHHLITAALCLSSYFSGTLAANHRRESLLLIPHIHTYIHTYRVFEDRLPGHVSS